MPDIFYLFSRWSKQVLLVTIITVVVAAGIIFLQPVRYCSTATALAANPAMSDKASIFNNNIQSLTSSLGGPDELDVVLGTAQLDTVYLYVAAAFNLWDHYKVMGKEEEQLAASASLLKKNTRVIKSDFGELKVKVWDSDKNLAPQLANEILEKLNTIHSSIQNENNRAVLANLKSTQARTKAEADSLGTWMLYDSVNAMLRSTIITNEQKQSRALKRTILLEQVAQYEKLINQYQEMFDTRPAALVIVEKARAAVKPDRPAWWTILIPVAFLGLLFGLLLSLVLEKRN